MGYQQELNFNIPTPPPPRRPAGKPGYNKRRIFAAAAGALVLIAAGVALLTIGPKKKSAPAIEPPPAAAVKNEPPPLKVSEEIIQKRQTLSKILSGFGFSGLDIDRLNRDVKPVFNLNKIIAGHWLRLYSDVQGVVQTIEYAIDDLRYLVITRDGSGFQAEKKSYNFETRLAYIWGTIEDNPASAVLQRNEQERLALDMTNLFAWDIDFYTELRRGDSFRMVYEKKFLDGQFYGYGEILAAEFICQGKKYQAFRFQYSDTKKADHFDRDGKSVRKEFLRSPLTYPRITSGFSFSRLHPILKVYTAHLGVDYGAPVGTPVHATADGVVISAGWNGPSGRMVHLRHKNSYETLYLHLSQIFVKEGDRVEGGETIGLVGSSGESTGPHLDYRIKQGGRYINPLSKRFDPVAPLRPEFKDVFKKEVEKYDFLLDAPRLMPRTIKVHLR